MLKKLIFLLKYMMKNNKILDNNSVSSFIDEAINQNVSPNLISYLYNYLYMLGSKEQIGINYIDDKIILTTMETGVDDNNHNITRIIRGIIELTEVADVKHSMIMLNVDFEERQIFSKKEIRYSLKDCIDTIVLERRVDNKFPISKPLEEIFHEEFLKNDCVVINFLDLDNLPYYETYDVSEGSLQHFSSYYCDKDFANFDNKNISIQTKRSLQNLRLLGTFNKGEDLDTINTLGAKSISSDVDLFELVKKIGISSDSSGFPPNIPPTKK